jgi:hypothetical protein
MSRPRTFAEIEAQLEAMAACSTKYRLLQALYEGRLTKGTQPESPELDDTRHVLFQ